MKTGKVYWQYRHEFLTKEITQTETLINTLEDERKEMLNQAMHPSNDAIKTRIILEQLQSKKHELRSTRNYLKKRKILLLEANKKLEVLAKTPYAKYF